MKNNLKKVLVFSFILGLIPFFTACTPAPEDDSETLKKRFETINTDFLDTFNKSKTKIYGKLACNTQPSLPDTIANIFGADRTLIELKRPSYKNFDFTKYDEGLIDDAFVPVREDYYIIINNDGYNPKKIDLYVDINGPKGPNIYGYDLFGYELQPDDTLVPLIKELDPMSNPNHFDELE